jgi:MoxR-like ATPase
LNRVLTADLKVINVKAALKKMKNKPWIKNLKIVNHFYFQLENHGTGHTYIYAADFLNLSEYNIKNAPIQGVMYQDPRNKNQTLIRTYAGVNLERLSNAENINLRRKDDILYINGVEFKLRHLQRGEGQEEINAKCLVETNRDYGKEIEDVAQQLNSRISEVEKNMFLTVTDRSQISKIAVELRKRIALTRVDIEKIYSQNELSL